MQKVKFQLPNGKQVMVTCERSACRGEERAVVSVKSEAGASGPMDGRSRRSSDAPGQEVKKTLTVPDALPGAGGWTEWKEAVWEQKKKKVLSCLFARH